MSIFKLPDLGEGLPDAEIHEWFVKVGDELKVDQPMVAMETAKAVVEVPSPQNGVVKTLYGEVGDVIETDNPLVEFESELSEEAPAPESGATVVGNIEVSDNVLEEVATGVAVKATSGALKALPAVRSLAKQLGVDISTLSGSGKQGEVTAHDVKKAAGIGSTNTIPASPALEVEGLKPLRGVRRIMAKSMAQSHAEVVGTTIVDDANLQTWNKKTDITARVIRAVVHACQQEPALNAWFDTATMSRKLFDEVHLGIAMDAGEGLFVPVIENTQALDATGLRSEIQRYKQEVKDRSVAQADLKGSTIALSNFGVFAGRYANPVVVPPTVAIIGTGKMRDEVVAVKGEAEVHRVMPLSLTFDHRAVTGGEASRFLGALMEDLAKSV